MTCSAQPEDIAGVPHDSACLGLTSKPIVRRFFSAGSLPPAAGHQAQL